MVKPQINVSCSFQEFGQICKLQRWRENVNVAPITRPTWQRAMREIPECVLWQISRITWGFSTAAIALAARTNFSQVFFRLMMLMPSVFFLKMYCSIVVSLLSEPMWVVAASILVMSSSCKWGSLLSWAVSFGYFQCDINVRCHDSFKCRSDGIS